MLSRCSCAVRSFVVAAFLASAVTTPSLADTLISYNAPPASVDFSGNTTNAGEVLNFTGGSIFQAYPYDAASEDTNALHVLSDGTMLLSGETTVAVNSVSFQGGDLLLYDPVAGNAGATPFFDGTTLFDAVENVDAAFLFESGPNAGSLLLSTTGTATLGGLVDFGLGDVVLYDLVTDVASVFFSQNEITGTAGQKNVDAVHLLPNGYLILSTAISGGSLGGISLQREDLVEWDPIAMTASVFLDGTNLFDGGTTTADLNAASITVPEPATVLLLGLGVLVAAAGTRRRAS